MIVEGACGFSGVAWEWFLHLLDARNYRYRGTMAMGA